ncbi:hypothetical protein [Biostraticola tofi]|uniref:hypothetical protein n=1 Tax=Biostraticola tofi TaxID=466109 RepID=UPI0038B26893
MVDSAGAPIVLVRMDNAAVPAGVELAPGKARRPSMMKTLPRPVLRRSNSGFRCR